MVIIKRFVILLLLALFAANHHTVMNGQSFEAEGIISYEVFSGSSETEDRIAHVVYDFRLKVNEDKWHLGLYDKKKADNYPYPTYESGFDGKYLYRYAVSDPDRFEGEPTVVNPAGTGSIYSDPVPKHDGGDFTNFIWTGLLSNRYLSSHALDGLLFYPLWHSDRKVPVDVALSKEPPFLPEEVHYWTGGVEDRGRVRGVFRRVEETVFESYTMPKELLYDGGNVKLRVSVTSYQTLGDEFSPKPEILGVIAVYDFRYRDVEPSVDRVSYLVDDKRWPGINDHPAITQYQAAIGRLGIEVEQRPRQKVGLLVGAIFIFLIGPLILVNMMRKRNKPNR